VTNKTKVATEYVAVCGMTECYTKCFCTPLFYLINTADTAAGHHM